MKGSDEPFGKCSGARVHAVSMQRTSQLVLFQLGFVPGIFAAGKNITRMSRLAMQKWQVFLSRG